MLRRIATNRTPTSLAIKLRKRRFLLFATLLSRVERPVRILDVGGTQRFWQFMGLLPTNDVHITLLNKRKQAISLPGFAVVLGDARQLPFTDVSFDVVFSNSVIEHVGGLADQRRMADEVKRVGKRYFVQTPNRYFPIEPHFLFPFFQFLPIKTRVWLLTHRNIGWYNKRINQQAAKRAAEGIRLLTKREVSSLFPEASLSEERVCGITKSFIVYHGWE